MSKAKATNRPDVYQIVTDKIVASLEQGVRPWAKPWENKEGLGFGGITRPLRFNGKPYRGINVFLLWGAAQEKGYTNPTWMTYKQATTLGGQVRGGEKGSLVIYASRLTKTEQDADGKDVDKSFFYWKGFSVFNVEQIDNLPARFHPAPVTVEETPAAKVERLGEVEAFFAATGAKIKHGGNSAYYSPKGDFIQVPDIEQFRDLESYYATLGHETVHWTGHEDRLNRDFSGRFGNEAYAAEELIAELGAAFLCADLGLALEPREDHAAYLASWLKVLKGDKRFVVQAASAAQKACDLLHSFQGEAVDVEEDEEAEAEREAA